MAAIYRIIGSEMSPFSVKVRSWFRFKAIPHRWIVGSVAVRERYRPYFRIPVIPVVVTPDDRGLQDSTPIMEMLEPEHDGQSIHPPDEVTRFLSCLRGLRAIA